MTDPRIVAGRRFRASTDATNTFFATHAERVSHACLEIARRFDRGGRLLVLGEHRAASDARHVAVEFVHPVLVGKRALPAMALTEAWSAGADGWTRRLDALARAEDMVLAIAHDGCPPAMARALDESRRRGRLTIALTGGGVGADVPADMAFHVPTADPLVAQEVQETLYHVFWELVHVFLRDDARRGHDASCSPDASGHCGLCGDEAHPGVVRALDPQDRTGVVSIDGVEREVAMDLVDGARVGDTVMVHQGFAIAALDSRSDPGRELYPFLYDEPPSHTTIERALADVRASTLEKCRDIELLRDALLEEYGGAFDECASAVAARLARGAKLIAFGNGGSATDADDAVADCQLPARAEWRALPALALTSDVAVLSAIANDVGFENVFARQLDALAEPIDVALGISTSGNSPNVAAAMRDAKRRGLLTVGLSGGDGGAMARSDLVDHCFVARTDYTPRVQEGQATVWHTLLELVHLRLS